MKIRILRATLVAGKVWDVGKTADVPIDLARELVASGKAEAAGEQPAAAGPMTTKTATAIVEGQQADDPPPAKAKKTSAGKEHK